MDASPRRRRITVRALTALMIGFAAAGLPACATPLDQPAKQPPQVVPSFAGISVDAANHSVGLRDVHIPHPGKDAYEAGASAPLSMQVGNNTDEVVSLTGATAGDMPVVLIGMGEQPSETFEIQLPPSQVVPLTQQAGRYLQISCLPSGLAVGATVSMTFVFSNGTKIKAEVPVGAWPAAGSPAPSPQPDPGACA